MFSFLRNLFKKDLANIIAPLENIHNKLSKYMDDVAEEIAKKDKEIAELMSGIALHQEEQKIANVVRDNLKTLLGKL